MNSTHIIKDRSIKMGQRMFAGAGVCVLVLALLACGGGNAVAAAATWTQAQFNTSLQASTLFQKVEDAVTGNTSSISTLKTQQASDEKLLSQVALIGHAPGSGIESVSRRTMAFHSGGTGFVTESVDFGTCSNMGTLIGFSAPNPAAAQVAFFKTCTGYWYGAYADDTSTHNKGDIFQPSTIWFTDSTCGANGGDAIMLSEGGVNKLAGQAGYGFMSPVDGTTEYAIAQGSTPGVMTSGSAFVAGSGCTVDVETQPGYTLAPNVVTTTGIPVAAPGNFTL